MLGRENMELALICMKQVFSMFLMILAGFVLTRAGIIKMEAKQHFSDLLLYLVIPCMVLNSYMAEHDASMVKTLFFSYGLSIVMIFVGVLLTDLFTLHMKNPNRPLVRFSLGYTNAAYFGFPLIQELFGDEGILYASAYVTVFNILLWTHGQWVLRQKRPGASDANASAGQPAASRKGALLSIIKNPVLISVVIGLIMFSLNFRLPDIILTPMQMIGNMNTPLAMFVTGMMIAGTSLPSLFRDKLILVTSFERLIAIPAVCLVLLCALRLSGMAVQVIFLLEAAPAAAITSVFAIRDHFDEHFGAGIVVVSTIFSIITLPVCCYLLTRFL